MDITIDNFEGPLDLLLHLIKKENISIYDISIEKITKQYLQYITEMEKLNLDIASEYLTMAAELIEIKSSSILPNENIDDEEEDNSREKLINRLLEYEQYKKMTESFKKLENYRNEVFTKEASNLYDFNDTEDSENAEFNLDDLINALKNVLKNMELSKPLDTKITNKEYSLNKRSSEIKSILKIKKKINFVDLFDSYSKDYIVITFLSILSLSKKHEIIIEQESNFKNIVIKGVNVNWKQLLKDYYFYAVMKDSH